MRLLLTGLSILIITTFSYSQEKEKEEEDEDAVEFKIVPYVSYNRTYDFMIGAVPLMMYKLNKKDTISPKSITGGMGVYTTNNSWFAVVFSQMYFNEDRWRITFAGGLGDVNAQFVQNSSAGNIVKYGTGANFFAFFLKRRIGKGLYIGPNYLYTRFENQFDTPTPIESQDELNGIGLSVLWDKRDDVYYPVTGHKLDLDFLSYASFLGNENASNEISLTVNKYLSKDDSNNVWAFRAYGAFGFGDVIFNNLLIMGGTDLRGYTQAEFRGKQLIAAQGEYRYNFHKKWGLVGFLGAGTVFESDIEENNGEFLPSAGAGLRYLVFPENKVRIGIEGAVGKNDWGIYFRIGESF